MSRAAIKLPHCGPTSGVGDSDVERRLLEEVRGIDDQITVARILSGLGNRRAGTPIATFPAGHVLDDDGVRADLDTRAHADGAEHLRARADHHVIADRGVALARRHGDAAEARDGFLL